jgi:GT2 family glycosyltransferase
MSERRPPRLLLAVLVYNGRTFVPACLDSVARVRSHSLETDVDALVLDDCSPDPGWSEELEAHCAELDLDYYRSPRNLGIPRNMNLALMRSLQAGYDYVIVANSDTVFPSNLADSMVAVAQADPRIGSVVAWANNAAIYSLQIEDDEIARLETVDWLSGVLAGEFGTEALDVPSGVGFCLLMPAEAVHQVGLFDPVFGRGYCEEVDWCLRSGRLGYRITLAPGVFVYHKGRGSTEAAGLIRREHDSVSANERILDLRYPEFRDAVASFQRSDLLDRTRARATERIVNEGARQFGYSVDASWLPHPRREGDSVRFLVDPDGQIPVLRAEFLGIRCEMALSGRGLLAGLQEAYGRPPERVTVFDRGRFTEMLREESAAGALRFEDRCGYPERV